MLNNEKTKQKKDTAENGGHTGENIIDKKMRVTLIHTFELEIPLEKEFYKQQIHAGQLLYIPAGQKPLHYV